MRDAQVGLRSASSLAALILGVGMMAPALAQEQEASPPKQDATSPAGSGPQVNSGGLDEIVVTAERREQRLQEVPISATVLSGDELATKGVANINDIQQVAPSIAINSYNRSTYINIRGVGIAQSAPSSNPGVAYYVDGQLISHEFFIGQSFYDIGAIEVLRGPQGTLTGQNSTGGAVFVRTPEPRFGEDPSGYVDFTYGNYGQVRVVSAMNFSNSDNVALRVAGIRDVRDSFSHNAGPSPSTPGDVDLWAVRANLALRTPDQALRINVRGEYFRSDNDNNGIKNRNDYILNVRTGTDPFLISEDGISRMLITGYRLGIEGRYELSSKVEVRALTNWQDAYVIDKSDSDRTSVSPAGVQLANNAGNGVGRVAQNRSDYKTFIQELNILSTGKGPLNWVVGGFVMDEWIPVLLQRDQTNTVQFVQPSNTSYQTIDNNSKSLFGQVNWFATPKIELIAGARHSWDKQVYNRIRSGAGQGATTGPAVGISTFKSQEWTGKLGFNFHATDDVLLYVTASKGYKAGGNNQALVTGTPPVAVLPFEPEKNFVYEGGWKTTLLDHHLRINGAVFLSNYKDIQLQSLQNGAPLTQNAATGRSYGGELEATAQFGGLNFNAGVGYLRARFAEDATIQNTITNALQTVHKGDVLPFSPDWTVNAGVQYSFDLGSDLKLTPRVQWSHLGEQIATPFRDVGSIVPSRDIFDARLSLDIGSKYRLEGYVSNFTDKVYIASQVQNSSSAAGGIIFGAPRLYGLRLVAKFGNE